MYWARANEATPSNMRYSREITFGCCGNLVGMYKILAALRYLADWIAEDFKPWAIGVFQ